MNILVIGAGNMGAAFVKQLTRAGHKVAVTARNLERPRLLQPPIRVQQPSQRPTPLRKLRSSCWPLATPMPSARCNRWAT